MPTSKSCNYDYVLSLEDNDASCPIDFRVISTYQQADQCLQQLLPSHKYIIKNIHRPNLIFYHSKVIKPATLLDCIITWHHKILNHPSVGVRIKPFLNTVIVMAWKREFKPLFVAVLAKKNKCVMKNYGCLPPTSQSYEPWECVQAELFGPWSYTDISGVECSIQAVSFVNVATRWIELH